MLFINQTSRLKIPPYGACTAIDRERIVAASLNTSKNWLSKQLGAAVNEVAAWPDGMRRGIDANKIQESYANIQTSSAKTQPKVVSTKIKAS